MAPRVGLSFLFIAVFIFCGIFTRSFGQNGGSATWVLTSNANSTTVGNVTGGAMVPGSSISVTGYGSCGVFAADWSTSSNTVGANMYYQFTFSPATGYNLTADSFLVHSYSAVPGCGTNATNCESGCAVAAYYSLNGFATTGTLFTGALFPGNGDDATCANLNQDVYLFNGATGVSVPNGSTLTIRLYSYANNTTGSGGDVFYVANVKCLGTTTAACSTPTISLLNPNTGAPGTSVDITGTNFTNSTGNTVTFSGIAAATPTSQTTTTMTVVVPSGAPCSSSVVVTNAGGCASAGTTFTVSEPIPTITGFSPTSACVGTTPTITITGTNFVSGGTTVTFSGSSAVTATYVSPTSATVTLPSNATNGTATITTCGGSSVSGVTFTITPNPSAITGTSAICATGSSTLNTVQLSDVTTGGTWTSGTPANATVNSSGLVTGVAGGSSIISYTVNGCAATTTVTVNTIPNVPNTSTAPVSPITCGTAITSMKATSAGNTIYWYNASTGGTLQGTSASNAVVSGFVPLVTTSYWAASQNGNGCQSSTRRSVGTVTVTAIAAPTVSTITAPTCATATGSVLLTGLPSSGTWTLTASPGGAITTGTGTSTTVSGLTAGTTYTFTVTNSVGCVSGSSGNVVIPAAPAISATPAITGIYCDGMTSVSGTGVSGATISVIRSGGSIGTTTVIGGVWTATVSTLSAGDVLTATSTEPGNCVSAASSSVTVGTTPTTATVNGSSTNTINVCGSLTTGSLLGNTPTVGTGQWSQFSGPGTTNFSSSGSSGSSTATASQTGTYIYYWTISSGSCTSTAIETVNYSAVPTATQGTTTSTTQCATADTFNIPSGYLAANGTISWSSSGNGTFTRGAATTTPTYTFGTADKSSGGLLTLTMTVDDGGLCTPATAVFYLTITPTIFDTIHGSTCASHPYSFGGQNYNITGHYNDTATSFVTNCDSITTLILSVTQTIYDTMRRSTCVGVPYSFGGQNYTVQGSYNDTVTSFVTSCDSITTLVLSITPTIYDTLRRSTCTGVPYPFGGHNYTLANSYNDTAISFVTNCDSVTTLVLSVTPIIYDTVRHTTCTGVPYSFGGQNYTTPGNYNDTATSFVTNCDSVTTLVLSVTPIIYDTVRHTTCTSVPYSFGGRNYTLPGNYNDTVNSFVTNCDSITTLVLSVTPIIYDTVRHTSCAGHPYSFGGQNYTLPGNYNDTTASYVTNCDSVTTLVLSVTPTIYDTLRHSICPGGSYSFGGQNYTLAGNYNDTATSVVSSCDSITTLVLSITALIYDTIRHTTCIGVPYSFGGQNYTSPGNYHDTATSFITNCDSVTTLVLSVTPNIYDTLRHSICPGASYSFGGQNYTVAGNYNDTVTSFVTNCDSITTLILSISPIIYDTVRHTICAGHPYSFGGQNYSLPGNYNDTVTSFVTNCDSITTLILSVTPTIYDTVHHTTCAGVPYSFGGQNYSSPGNYNDTATSFVTNCDSVTTLILSVTPIIYDTVRHTTCAGVPYSFGGQNYSSPGNYNDTATSLVTNCDSVTTLILTVTPLVYDTVRPTICAGHPYSFGGQNYSSPGNYNDTATSFITNCDSVTTLVLSVIPSIYDTLRQTVCPGASYSFGGQNYSLAGSYNDTATSFVTNCDSVTTLVISVIPIIYDTVRQAVCPGGSYSFGGQNYSLAGNYNDTATSIVTNCDSVTTLVLSITPIIYDTVRQAVCPGGSYSFGGQNYSLAGNYNDTATSFVTTCDSVTTLVLSIIPIIYDTIRQTICPAASYSFGGQNYTLAGNYNDTVTSFVSTCDSITTLVLTIATLSHHAIAVGICPGGQYNFNGTNLSVGGPYSDTLIGAGVGGCDSILDLTLTVYAPIYITLNDTVAWGGSVQVGGTTYSQTGVYIDTLTGLGIHGCDSVIDLNLYITPPTTYATLVDTICQGFSYSLGSNVYTASGTYIDTFTNYLNGDSIVTLRLFVAGSLTTFYDTICVGGSYVFHQNTYTQPGIYSDTLGIVHGCYNIEVLNLAVLQYTSPSISITVSHGPIVNGMQIDTFTASITNCSDPYYGWFQNIVPLGEHGPVAIVVYPADQKDSFTCRVDCRGGCASPGHVYSNNIYATGINELISSIQGISIYPNPTQGSFNMDINSLSMTDRDAQITVIDLIGQPILNQPISLHPGDNKNVITLSESAGSGVYIIRLTVEGRSAYYRIVLEK